MDYCLECGLEKDNQLPLPFALIFKPSLSLIGIKAQISFDVLGRVDFYLNKFVSNLQNSRFQGNKVYLVFVEL